MLFIIQILEVLRGEKDGEEWFKAHIKELKKGRKREEVGFDLRLVEDDITFTSHNCVIKEERKRFTLEEFLRG